ncbi:MAG: response regulator transcription factor [Candidatus Acididesulfobacter diazotrophicus]|jgi:two-component system OmpR family response regulator|uniref:Response regulator transcription factor n=1 Tax=Candidatus Acididesulfobacter diazotrophicus TaxID=2597226 RepID=A0A519BKD6_9DELT|nr:MAG: response regulator transcription factor [Candidatus Acididesulfobacter diazotrophicus]
MIKIIMIEDDNEIASLLKEYLHKFNIELINFENSKEGLEAISNNSGNNFDVLILDLTLPDIDGLEVCKLVSEISDIPIIISSARSDDADIVTGLEIGADDYVSKPYNPRELVARIRSVIRRKDRLKHAEQMPDGTYIPDESSNINIYSNNNIKHFEIDEDKMIIKKEEKTLDLTSAEYELFSILLKNKDRVITRDFILENMKTMNYESIDRSVDVIIGRIRKKISDDPKNPKYIKSIRGYGYKFVE